MKQLKWRELFFNGCIALNSLLLFLLIFDPYLRVPAYMQVLGRAHPLMLHFPIVLLLAAFLLEWLLRSPRQRPLLPIADTLLLAAAFTTVVTALMGLLLSKEEGYDSDALYMHKWMGAACSFLSIGWYAFRSRIRGHSGALIATGFSCCMVLLIAGHKGAAITHGNDFLLAPVISKTTGPAVPLQTAVIYTHLIQPILENKCMGCHNRNKAKGELIMETTQLLLRGGKNGKLWDTTAADLGLLMQRIHLPPDSKEHMPPKGKPQLTEEETSLLYLWIKDGASFTKKVVDLPGGDSLRMLASSFFKNDDEEEAYDFAAADEQLITGLNTEYRVITPLAQGSPALAVDFYGTAAFKAAQLKDLEKIKNNIVSLQLSRMPVTDEDLKTIGAFRNLRTLNLSFTAIKGNGLRYLSGLQHLRQLSLSGTGVQPAQLHVLAPIKTLHTVQIWNTSLTTNDLAALKARFPQTAFNIGYKGDTVIAKLSTPVFKTQQRIFKNNLLLEIKNPIKSAVTRYTLDGSEPDSLQSPVYRQPIPISQAATVKARSYLPGWITSDVAKESFYKSSIQPDSIQLITAPEKAYQARAQEGKALIDALLGNENFGTKEWIGYKVPFEAYLFFKQPATVSSVTFGSLVSVNSFIMPAHELQVWGGASAQSLKLLGRLQPVQPTAVVPAYTTGYECHFTAQPVQVIKLIAKPVTSLPSWHTGKGQKAWVFLDEILVN